MNDFKNVCCMLWVSLDCKEFEAAQPCFVLLDVSDLGVRVSMVSITELWRCWEESIVFIFGFIDVVMSYFCYT